MAYKKDQGRYARMTAFWGLFLLAADGCLRGLQSSLRGWFPAWGTDWTDPLPLIGEVDAAKLVSVLVLALIGYTLHRILNRPKVADTLIETEGELKKVTWPSGSETWTGTIAVIVTVLVLLVYLFAADILLSQVLPPLMGATS